MRVLSSLILPVLLASAAWGPPPASDGIAEALAKIKGLPIPQGRAVTQGNTQKATPSAPVAATTPATSTIEEGATENTYDSLHPIGDDAAVVPQPAAVEVSAEEKIPSIEAAPGFDMNAQSSTENAEQQEENNEAVVTPAEGADVINQGFSYLGASCGSSNVSTPVFASNFFFQAVNYIGKDSEGVEPRALVNACMKKCEAAQTKDTQLPCTGVHFDEEGNCKLHFMEMDVAASSVSFLSANKPYGCYRRADVPSFQAPGYTLIGAAACQSTFEKQYATVATEFNGPWSPVDMMSYCSKICDRNQDCVGFTASETCKVLMGSMASTPSELEKTYLQKPFGCYRKLAEGEEVLVEAGGDSSSAPAEEKTAAAATVEDEATKDRPEPEAKVIESPNSTAAGAEAVERVDIDKEEEEVPADVEAAKPDTAVVETTAETAQTEDMEAAKPQDPVAPTSAIEERQDENAVGATVENETAAATDDAAEKRTEEVVNVEEVPAKTAPAPVSEIYPLVQALF